MKYIVQDKILIQVANPYEVQKQALFIAYKNFIAMFYSFNCYFIQQRFHRAISLYSHNCIKKEMPSESRQEKNYFLDTSFVDE